MILALFVGCLGAVLAAVLARPLLTVRTRGPVVPATSDATSDGTDERRVLLRQLRDLDDDLATGKLSDADHRRLRRGLEHQVRAAIRTGSTARPARGSRSGPGTRVTGAASAAPSAGVRPKPVPTRTRWVRRGVGVAVALGTTVGVGVLLLGAVHERGPDAAATGGPPPAAGGGAQTAGAAVGTATAPELSAVQDAVDRVRQNPRQVSAHLDLARAYAAADQPQLAAVEYLAATRLDPTNAEANTALALLAFTAGNAEQAEALADKALAEHPAYPEALYTRGLIRAMGLHHPAQARVDLYAYLEAAPFGAHRTTVETVLALIDEDGSR